MNEIIAKALLVGAVALYMGIVTFNNITDYGSNLAFVQHVLSMDTTFPGNRLMWRALPSAPVHHAFYAGIMAWEGATALALAWASVRLWRARLGDAAARARAKSFAACALVANLLLWFLAFLTVGGEWFAMWQSQVWNGQTAAFRMFACVGIVLLYVRMPEEPPEAGGPPPR